MKTIPRDGGKENLKELKPAWKNKLSFRVHLDSFLIFYLASSVHDID